MIIYKKSRIFIKNQMNLTKKISGKDIDTDIILKIVSLLIAFKYIISNF